jgi:uncharacterized protein YdaU (DUF1376 family)
MELRMNKSPAFRFYPGDFMSSPDVQAMDLHEVGAYMFLMCFAWESARHGYLPDQDDKLRRWAKMTREQWTESREVLLAKFPVVEEGWRANPRLVREAEKQAEYSAKQAANGSKGGRPKKPSLYGENPPLSDKKPRLLKPKPDESQEKPSVSVSAFASVSAEKKRIATAVMRRTSLSGKFVREAIETAVEGELSAGVTASPVENLLVQRWEELVLAKPKLEYVWSAEKFFGERNWKHPEAWPYKQGMKPSSARPQIIYQDPEAMNA